MKKIKKGPLVKERIPLGKATKVIPDEKKSKSKKKCREKVEEKNQT